MEPIPLPRRESFFLSYIVRAVCWYLGFPPATTNYNLTSLKIPIGTGSSRIELVADLYQPLPFSQNTKFKPSGTLLIRSPYGRSFLSGLSTARAYAARGYVVLYVCCRGTDGSGGDFTPFRTEVSDGKEVVTWMRAQPWYTGSFATLGPSYLGFVQWALLADPEVSKDMKTAVVSVAPHDFGQFFWGNGSFNLDAVGWANLMVAQASKSMFQIIPAISGKSIKSTWDSVPLLPAVEKHFKGDQAWLIEAMEKTDMEDEYYEPMRLQRALENVKIPVLLVSGWYDLFLDQTMVQYARLRDRGCKVGLVVGDWSHMQAPGAPKVTDSVFKWMQEHVANLPGEGKTSEEDLARYFVTGSNIWKSAPTFPPPSTPTPFHLHPKNLISPDSPPSEAGESSFTFNPANPTPSIGGNKLFAGGRFNDTALASRTDVLTSTTAPLPSDIEICGTISIHLSHTTDIPFADLFVRISDVDEKGRSWNVTDAYKRLDPKQDLDGGKEEVVLELNVRAHCFKKGRRMRLYVAGGCHPHYARNTGYEDGMRGDEMRCVRHTIQLGAERGSKIVLPVVGGSVL